MADAWLNFVWSNRRHGEPIDIVRANMWVADGPDFVCRVCKADCCGSYEVTVEWGDTKSYEYISDVCSLCMNRLASQSRNAKDIHYM